MIVALELRQSYWQRLADAAAVVGGEPPDPDLCLRRKVVRKDMIGFGISAAIVLGREDLAEGLARAFMSEMIEDMLAKLGGGP